MYNLLHSYDNSKLLYFYRDRRVTPAWTDFSVVIIKRLVFSVCAALPRWRHLTHIKQEEGNPCFSHTDHNNLRLVPCPRAPVVAACFCRRCYYVAFGRFISFQFSICVFIYFFSCERRSLPKYHGGCWQSAGLSTVWTPSQKFIYGRATSVQPWPFILRHVTTSCRIIFTSGVLPHPHPSSDIVCSITARCLVLFSLVLLCFKGTLVVFWARTALNKNRLR